MMSLSVFLDNTQILKIIIFKNPINSAGEGEVALPRPLTLNSQPQFSQDEGSTSLCSLAHMRKGRCRSKGHTH